MNRVNRVGTNFHSGGTSRLTVIEQLCCKTRGQPASLLIQFKSSKKRSSKSTNHRHFEILSKEILSRQISSYSSKQALPIRERFFLRALNEAWLRQGVLFFFFFSLFFREMKKRVWRWSRVSIKISRSLGCWRGGGMPRKEFISETREWQCARSRQSSIEPLSRTVACTGDELCSPLHESREDRGVFWTWLAHRRHQQLLLTAPRRRFSREHGEHLPLSRTPAAHFLDNARIIVYEAAYNSIDRHFIHLSLSLTHTQTHTGARALLCDSPSIVFLLSYGSQCLAIFHTMSISRFKILCIL